MNEVEESNDPDVQMLLKQDSSDEISSIEADLDGTDLSSIDSEFTQLDASLQSP